jgi:hypothetical protein
LSHLLLMERPSDNTWRVFVIPIMCTVRFHHSILRAAQEEVDKVLIRERIWVEWNLILLLHRHGRSLRNSGCGRPWNLIVRLWL